MQQWNSCILSPQWWWSTPQFSTTHPAGWLCSLYYGVWLLSSSYTLFWHTSQGEWASSGLSLVHLLWVSTLSKDHIRVRNSPHWQIIYLSSLLLETMHILPQSTIGSSSTDCAASDTTILLCLSIIIMMVGITEHYVTYNVQANGELLGTSDLDTWCKGGMSCHQLCVPHICVIPEVPQTAQIVFF